MTRQKSKKIHESLITTGHGMTGEDSGEQIASVDLRSQFNALDPKEQDAIINFFNLHNAATWIFNSLSEPGLEYVKLCIELSREKVMESV